MVSKYVKYAFYTTETCYQHILVQTKNQILSKIEEHHIPMESQK